MSNSEESTSNEDQPPVKRAFLEISELDKYKNLLINKPFETKKLKTSDTLNRVKQFLPSLKESTDKLLEAFKENPSNFDIENCENDDNVIEMNLQFVKESDSDSDSDDDDDDDKSSEENSDNDKSKEGNDLKVKKVLDINELIEKDQIKITGDTLFKNKKIKKPFIKIINNNNENSQDQPCTSKDTQ
jgi:hypothetical protein